MITNEIRQSKLAVAPTHLQELYTSLETATLIGSVRKRYSIENGAFVEIVGDIILGLYPKGDFRKLLVSALGMTEEVAVRVEGDLQDLLFKIDGVAPLPPAPKDTREKLEFRPTEGVPSTGTPSPKPLTREEVLQAIQPKRTMASDIESVKQKGDVPAQGYEAYYANEKKGGE